MHRDKETEQNQSCPFCGITPTIYVESQFWDGFSDPPQWENEAFFEKCPGCEEIWNVEDYRGVPPEM